MVSFLRRLETNHDGDFTIMGDGNLYHQFEKISEITNYTVDELQSHPVFNYYYDFKLKRFLEEQKPITEDETDWYKICTMQEDWPVTLSELLEHIYNCDTQCNLINYKKFTKEKFICAIEKYYDKDFKKRFFDKSKSIPNLPKNLEN